MVEDVDCSDEPGRGKRLQSLGSVGSVPRFSSPSIHLQLLPRFRIRIRVVGEDACGLEGDTQSTPVGGGASRLHQRRRAGGAPRREGAPSERGEWELHDQVQDPRQREPRTTQSQHASRGSGCNRSQGSPTASPTV